MICLSVCKYKWGRVGVWQRWDRGRPISEVNALFHISWKGGWELSGMFQTRRPWLKGVLYDRDSGLDSLTPTFPLPVGVFAWYQLAHTTDPLFFQSVHNMHWVASVFPSATYGFDLFVWGRVCIEKSVLQDFRSKLCVLTFSKSTSKQHSLIWDFPTFDTVKVIIYSSPNAISVVSHV